jgi:HAD superfamily hydrolase (TIGR01509 family)
VLTDTARIHRHAWKVMFDEFLCRRALETGEEFVPFDEFRDYEAYIDGRLRYDGVRSFLSSRRIELPDGSFADPPSATTVCGLGNRKERAVIATLRTEGVSAFDGSARYLVAARNAGLRRAVVSASTNCRAILRRADLDRLLEVRVDGRIARELELRGKPAPDTYLEAARRLGVPPSDAAVFEDAVAGVDSAVAGGFGFVVGVDRSGAGRDLARHGASVVVGDLAELLEPTT